MKAQKSKCFMAGSIPHGKNEPAYVQMYKGNSVYSFTDTEGALRLFMCDSDGNVTHGCKEALEASTRQKIEEKYNIQLVRNIG
jgi:hypothetical protein